MCLNNENLSITRITFNIESMVETFSTCFPANSDDAFVDRFIKWNNNNHSSIILNVDGNCLGSPIKVGYSGVLRNNPCFYLLEFSDYIQDSNNVLHAKLFAIYQGLLLAKEMDIVELVCYSYPLHCINLIHGPHVVPCLCGFDSRHTRFNWAE